MRRCQGKPRVNGINNMEIRAVEGPEKVETKISAARDAQRFTKCQIDRADPLLYTPPRNAQSADGDCLCSSRQNRKRSDGAHQGQRKVVRRDTQGGRSARRSNAIVSMEESKETASSKGTDITLKISQARYEPRRTRSSARMDIQNFQSRNSGQKRKKRKVARRDTLDGKSARRSNGIVTEASREKSSSMGTDLTVKESQPISEPGMTRSRVRMDIEKAPSPLVPCKPSGNCAHADSTGTSDNSHERDDLKDVCHPTSEKESEKDSVEREASIISSSIEKLDALSNFDDSEASQPRELPVREERTLRSSYIKERRSRSRSLEKKNSPVQSLSPLKKCISSPSDDDEMAKPEADVSAVCGPTVLDDLRCTLTPVGSAPPLERSVLRTSGLIPIYLLARYIHSALGLQQSQSIHLLCCGEDLKDISALTLQQLAEQIWKEPRTPILLEYGLL